MGPGLVYSGKVEDLEKNQFAIGNLFGKLLFIDDDVKSGSKLPDGPLKKISEAKTLSGERKFRDAFEFQCRAFPILLCNNDPSLADLSYGMMRRLRVLPFDRQFKKSEEYRSLFDRIIGNELPGVLNRALRGWKRLQKNGRFTIGADIRRATRRFVAQSNPLQGFIDECCVRDDDGRSAMKEFYARFRDWTQENGFTMVQSQPSVRKNLEHMGFRVPRHGMGRVIKGLTIKRRDLNS
jgi:P4 family phage/plasmid primase-like protien